MLGVEECALAMKRGILMLALALGAGVCVAQMPVGEHDHMAAKSSVPSTSLVVTVEGKTATLSLADLQAMPQTTVAVKNGHSGGKETYTGVAVGDLLARYGFAYESATAKRVYHSYVKAEGADGYWVLYSGSELEGALRETGAVIALAVDGKPLGGEGAFKIVIAGERKPARWVRNLKALTVVTVD